MTSLIWEMGTSDNSSRSRNKVASFPYWQMFKWRKTLLMFLLCWIWKENSSRKKSFLFNGFGGFLGFFSFVWGFLSNIHSFFMYPLCPTLSWLSRAAARSHCHHLFLYFPHLGCWNRSWFSFLADSVISARPQLGEVPRPTGDPCSYKAAGRRLCMKETVHQRGHLALLHLAV